MQLEADNIFFAYEKEKNILKGVSFRAVSGRITGLIGANGTGKTTIIKNLLGILKPDQGKILLDEADMQGLPPGRRLLSYIPDIPVCYDELSVQEHMKFISAVYHKEPDEAEKWVCCFQMEEYLFRLPSELSKGTRQKLSIILSLLRNYEILAADEPFTALDPEQIHNLTEVFHKLKQEKKGILLSTHLLGLAEEVCDHFVIVPSR